MRNISFVLPVYNEAAAIRKTVCSLKNKFKKAEIIVSDDGSSDGTAYACKGLGVVVLRHQHIGYGAAVCRGIRAAKGDLIVVVDADLPFSLNELKTVFETQGNGSLIICYRRGYPTINNGFFRAMRHRLYNFLVGGFLSLNVRDINGIKLIPRSAIRGISMHGTGWIFGAELSYRFYKKGKRICEMPVTFCRRQDTLSHFTIRSVVVLFRELLELRAGCL